VDYLEGRLAELGSWFHFFQSLEQKINKYIYIYIYYIYYYYYSRSDLDNILSISRNIISSLSVPFLPFLGFLRLKFCLFSAIYILTLIPQVQICLLPSHLLTWFLFSRLKFCLFFGYLHPWTLTPQVQICHFHHLFFQICRQLHENGSSIFHTSFALPRSAVRPGHVLGGMPG